MRAHSLAIVLVLCAGGLLAGEAPAIHSVAVSKPFFNPTVGEKIRIAFEASRPGQITVLVVDRDGYPVRLLASELAIQAGNVGFDWDGRDDRGSIVPDEAYFPRIVLARGEQSDVLDPLAQPAQPIEFPRIEQYNRQTGNFTYRLKSPSRVHIQAGQSRRNPGSGETSGPVLRTIVDRQPRTSGKILEVWRGYSADGSVLVSELNDFVMAIAASPLPEHALLTVGNTSLTFFDYALESRSEKDREPRIPPSGARHHESLNAFQDKSPDLTLRVAPCSWHREVREWRCPSGELDVEISMDKRQEPYFSSIAANPIVFVDGERLGSVRFDSKKRQILISPGALKDGDHVVAVNWPSWNGPVGIGVAHVRLDATDTTADSSGQGTGNE